MKERIYSNRRAHIRFLCDILLLFRKSYLVVQYTGSSAYNGHAGNYRRVQKSTPFPRPEKIGTINLKTGENTHPIFEKMERSACSGWVTVSHVRHPFNFCNDHTWVNKICMHVRKTICVLILSICSVYSPLGWTV